MTIRHDCKSRGCYKDACLPDWGIFDGCFDAKSPKISIGDLDGVVEVNGKILFLEWKRKECELSYGQMALFKTLTRNSEKQSVLVIYGSVDGNGDLKYQTIHKGNVSEMQDCDAEFIRKMLKRWTYYAMESYQ